MLAAIGCSQSSPGSSYPFEGSWCLGYPGFSGLSFSSTNFSATGSFGSVACSIESIDSSANHVQTVVTTAGTPSYIGRKQAATIYMTYSVSGSKLNFARSSTGYPSTATGNGPYTKK